MPAAGRAAACSTRPPAPSPSSRLSRARSTGGPSLLAPAGNAGPRHILGRQYLIELLLIQQSALGDDLPDWLAGAHRFLGNVGRRRVSDVRTQRRRDRGAAIHQLARSLGIGLDAVDTARAQYLH